MDKLTAIPAWYFHGDFRIEQIGDRFRADVNTNNFYHSAWVNGDFFLDSRNSKDALDEARAVFQGIVGDIVYLQIKDTRLPGRELRGDSGTPRTDDVVITLAENGQCLLIQEVAITAAQEANARFPNNVFFQAIKVDCL